MTSGTRVPLSVLDLSPISSGSVPADALHNTLDLAKHAEALGYHRYWLAEHHLSPAAAAASPAVMTALVTSATTRIRVGSGAVLLTHANPLVVLEQFGSIAALYPGRIDLGLGRSLSLADLEKRIGARDAAGSPPAHKPEPSLPRSTPEGLFVPSAPNLSRLAESPTLQTERQLLWRDRIGVVDYREQVRELLTLWKGEFTAPDGTLVHANPAEGTDMAVWVLGSSPGVSSQVAAELGLPFTANYHQSPSTVIRSVESYRERFTPSTFLSEPYVMVSAEVVTADDDETARKLASPIALSVLALRTGLGYIAVPTPEDAAAHPWTSEERQLIADRMDTQFVGSPDTVVAGLEVLQKATGAHELIVISTTHRHEDRRRSYELLANAWGINDNRETFRDSGMSAVTARARN